MLFSLQSVDNIRKARALLLNELLKLKMLKNYFFNRSHLVWMIFGILAVAIIAMPEVFAQETAADGGGSEDVAPVTKSLWDNIVEGGWAMYPLGLLSVGFITLMVYNSMQLTAKKFVPPELKASVLDKMAEVRVRSAIEAAADSVAVFFAHSSKRCDLAKRDGVLMTHDRAGVNFAPHY